MNLAFSANNYIESTLDAKINQTIETIFSDDQKSIDILENIKEIPSISKRLSKFCDFLISNINLVPNKAPTKIKRENKKSINEYEVRMKHLAKVLKVHESDIEKSIESMIEIQSNSQDYEDTLNLLKCKRGQLLSSVNELIQSNIRLQRLHNQDRTIMLKQQQQLISQTKWKLTSEEQFDESLVENSDSDSIRNEIKSISEELSMLRKKISKRTFTK